MPPPIGTTREARWPDTLPGLHGVAVVKTEIVLRIPALGSEFVVATVYADTMDRLEKGLKEVFAELSWKIPEQFLLDRLEEEL